MKCCWEVTRHETEGNRPGKLTKAQEHAAVPEVLTAEEYKTITGEEYTA